MYQCILPHDRVSLPYGKWALNTSPLYPLRTMGQAGTKETFWLINYGACVEVRGQLPCHLLSHLVGPRLSFGNVWALCVHSQMCHGRCGGQRAALGSWFCSFTMWVFRLDGNYLYLSLKIIVTALNLSLTFRWLVFFEHEKILIIPGHKQSTLTYRMVTGINFRPSINMEEMTG